MSNPTIPALYGQTNDPMVKTQPLTEATNEFEIKTQGKNFAKIKSGKETIDVPRAKYIKELEDKIERLEKEIKKANADNRKLTSAVNSIIKDVNSLTKELKNKVDRF